ncbi:MAG: cyclopropane fatty acyl phospholipid synthase [Candidatus Solibacter sp.]|jgi:cyclopropane-fatty-acyl-phospholipid synthase
MSSPRTSLYRGPAEQPPAIPPKPHFRALRIAPRGSTAAARKVAEVFALAGIEIGGRRPWDLQVHDQRFYPRLLAGGDLAAGESYMDGWWDAEALDEMCTRVHRANLPALIGGWEMFWLALKSRVFNRQRRSQAGRVAHVHYDLGNDVYQAMLDRRMQYTCAYWQDAATLDQAQENKLHLICRKMQLQPGMTVLELGGGFGGLAHFMATQYGCRVAMYNISAAQVAHAREWCKGLPVRIEQKDYREAARETGTFDRVVSVGLCEHIGQKNYRGFLDLTHRLLSPGGLFLLHTIGGNESYTCTDAWIDKYIFPNGMTPSVSQLGKAMEGRWVVEDWHNFGPDYDPTLMAWWRNFDRAWPSLEAKYGERFYRMWKYYLLGCAGGFRARRLQLWQLVLSKGDIPWYTPVR